MFGQDLRVLRPLELIQQLSAQHDVEVLPDPRHHFIDRVLSAWGGNTQQRAQLLQMMKSIHFHSF